MGKIESRNLFYVLALTLLIAGLFTLLNQTRKQRHLSLWQQAEESFDSSSTHLSNNTQKIPQGRWQSAKSNSAHFQNDYIPAANYANTYVPQTEYQHPLVASTTFVKKKDQKKGKAGKKKQTLNAKNTDSSKKRNRQFGLSENMNSSLSNSSVVGANLAHNRNQQNKKKETENLNTVEYWEKPIFVEQDVVAVGKLIESYQIQKVSSNVFYDLVTEMRQDERTQIREFGLLALGSTPSTRSFTELTWIKHNDPEGDLRNEAHRQIASYTEANRLGYVVSALNVSSTESAKATLEALVLLSNASQKYGDLIAFNGTSPKQQPVNLAVIEPKFEQALSLIEQKHLAESQDSKIKLQAAKTSESLNRFLSL